LSIPFQGGLILGKKAFLYIAFGASFVLSLLVGTTGVCISTISSDSPILHEFYYYNPDSPQSNLGRLKQEFDAFLSQNNFPYTFQPFTHFADFHRLSSEKRPSFILVPEWYYRRYGESLGLKPLLVPVRNGNTSYQKILLVGSGTATAINDYDIISFAMTTMGPEGEVSVVRDLLTDQLVSLQQLNIINVPKDLDAILALVLGQVKMALVAQDNLQVISDANPKITQMVKKLEKSITVPMPVLCYLEGRVKTKDVERLLEAFRKMASEQPRNKIMEMLQIDDWRKISK